MSLFNITFAYPWVFLLLLTIPAMYVWNWFRSGQKESGFIYSNFKLINEKKKNTKERFIFVPMILRSLAILFLVIALARPQSFDSGENVSTEGVDIVLVLDLSGSMLAEDFKPNRIEAAKKITQDFIDGRTSDRIGLVVFSREAFTQCPVTIDYGVLKNLLREVKSGMIEDGTAIGNAIANGINRLKDSKAKSKVMILLTDGVNNAGEVDPLTAAEIARTYGIRIYTIGIGTIGQAPYPFQTPFGTQYQMMPVEIDEAVLRKISSSTNGKYFRATGNQKLEGIYQEIDKLEKTRIEVTSYRNKKDLFYPWAAVAGAMVLLELILTQTYFRKLP